MSHLATQKIDAWLNNIPQGMEITHVVLPELYKSILIDALKQDAVGLLYSSKISFIDAIRGVVSGFPSWAVVKLYYSAFYAARSILASNSVAIYYRGTKPYSIIAETGNTLKKENGQTHKLVWKLLEREFPNISILGEIESSASYAWMTQLREQTNYRTAKFSDPALLPCFNYLDTRGVDRSISAYWNDESMMYCFDPDHAVVAFPLECIKHAIKTITAIGCELEDSDKQHILNCCSNTYIPENVFS